MKTARSAVNRALDFSDNNASNADLQQLVRQYPDLVQLNLARNAQLTSLFPLGQLKHLRALLINRTSVNTLEPLRGLSGLQELTASNCAISDISALQTMPSLTVIYLDNNQIASMDQLQVFRALGSLQRLWLQGNPVCAQALYKETLRGCVCSSIKNLDGGVISAEQQKEFLAAPEAVVVTAPTLPALPVAKNALEERLERLEQKMDKILELLQQKEPKLV